MSVSPRIPLLAVFLAINLSACAVSQQGDPAQKVGDIDKLDVQDSQIELDVQGAEGISEGWIEYKVVLRNLGSQPLSDIKVVMTDQDGIAHQPATSPAQLKQLPSGMNESIAQVGTTAAAQGLAMLGIPFASQLLSAGSTVGTAYARGEATKIVDIQQRFPSVSIIGRELSVNDELVGSVFFPVAVPASVKIGYIRSGTREWSSVSRSNRDALSASNSELTGSNLNRATVEIQEHLNKLGYPCGKADGQIGKQTKLAIERYQADTGLLVDGLVSEGLLASLRSET